MGKKDWEFDLQRAAVDLDILSQTIDIQTSMPRDGKPALLNISNVVAGILMEKKMFLVEKRRAQDEADPGYVEIPGGHVDPDETLEDALRRETKE